MEYELRQAKTSDRVLIYELYRAVLGDYISRIWGWDDAWQQNDFNSHFKPEQITVITVKNKMAGYLQVENRSKTLYVRMIAILPQYQGSGIGSRVLRSLIDTATWQKKDVDLQVFKINPAARRFYERLGFEIEEETAAHYRMRRKTEG